jgi:hypothetical protein
MVAYEIPVESLGQIIAINHPAVTAEQSSKRGLRLGIGCEFGSGCLKFISQDIVGTSLALDTERDTKINNSLIFA